MPPVPNGLQAQFAYTGAGGASAMNIVNFVNIGSFPSDEALDGVSNGWGAVVTEYMSSQWSLDANTRWLDLEDDPPTEYISDHTAHPGETAGGVLPAQCAMVLSLNANAGRRGRGRIYLPGVAEGTVDDSSILNAGTVTAVSAAFEDWLTEVCIPAGLVVAVYSRLDGVVRPILTFGIDPVVDTQRRRVARLDT